VQFDDRRAGALRSLDLRRIRIDEQRDPDARGAQRRHGIADPRPFEASHIQAALGGDFLARFRHQAAILRQHLLRDADHLLGHRHFQIHAGLQRLAHDRDVPILDVPPILAQVQGDAVRARLLRQQRRIQGIGIAPAARLAQGRHVIDIHAERDACQQDGHFLHPRQRRHRSMMQASMTSRDFKERPSRQASMAARNTRLASRKRARVAEALRLQIGQGPAVNGAGRLGHAGLRTALHGEPIVLILFDRQPRRRGASSRP
jgi:hypothetical protein